MKALSKLTTNVVIGLCAMAVSSSSTKILLHKQTSENVEHKPRLSVVIEKHDLGHIAIDDNGSWISVIANVMKSLVFDFKYKVACPDRSLLCSNTSWFAIQDMDSPSVQLLPASGRGTNLEGIALEYLGPLHDTLLKKGVPVAAVQERMEEGVGKVTKEKMMKSFRSHSKDTDFWP